jgi:hypothetical protein
MIEALRNLRDSRKKGSLVLGPVRRTVLTSVIFIQASQMAARAKDAAGVRFIALLAVDEVNFARPVEV